MLQLGFKNYHVYRYFKVKRFEAFTLKTDVDKLLL